MRPAPPRPLADLVGEDERALARGSPWVRVAVVSDLALSFGVGTPRSGDIAEHAAVQGVPAVRRSTGGSWILHRPGDLVWSVVLPRTHPKVGADFASAFGRLGEGVVSALARVRVRAQWDPSPGLSDQFCLLGPRGSVLAVQGRVVGGAAQHLARGGLLHHGTVSASLDRARLSDLFGLPRETVAARLTSLDELGVRAPRDELVAGLESALRADLGVAAGP